MSFSIDHDGKNKSLGRASFNKIETKKSGLKLDEHKMPPIIDFDSNETKQSDWDSIICIHQGIRLATTWDYIKSTMGKYKIDNDRFASHLSTGGGGVLSTVRILFSILYLIILYLFLKCCTITSCGNFCVIGYSSGHVDLYNMQSGQFRATYGESKGNKMIFLFSI
jgi:U3 small nucleolar RNA-associated protein 21